MKIGVRGEKTTRESEVNFTFIPFVDKTGVNVGARRSKKEQEGSK